MQPRVCVGTKPPNSSASVQTFESYVNSMVTVRYPQPVAHLHPNHFILVDSDRSSAGDRGPKSN